MKWSWKLGEIAGIGIYVHATFLLLLGWVALRYYLAGQSLAMMLNGIVFLLTLFGIVVLHELGHALTATRFRIPRRIARRGRDRRRESQTGAKRGRISRGAERG